nr:hypothetical protein [Sphingobium boeckii]
MRAILPLAALALMTSASALAAKTDRNAVPAATPDGPAIDCVQISAIRDTRVHGDKVIDFHMRGGKVYRNELPYQCSSLGFEERFSYQTSINRLCSVDVITVLRNPPLTQGPSCGLGKFQPVKLARKK